MRFSQSEKAFINVTASAAVTFPRIPVWYKHFTVKLIFSELKDMEDTQQAELNLYSLSREGSRRAAEKDTNKSVRNSRKAGNQHTKLQVCSWGHWLANCPQVRGAEHTGDPDGTTDTNTNKTENKRKKKITSSKKNLDIWVLIFSLWHVLIAASARLLFHHQFFLS